MTRGNTACDDGGEYRGGGRGGGNKARGIDWPSECV